MEKVKNLFHSIAYRSFKVKVHIKAILFTGSWCSIQRSGGHRTGWCMRCRWWWWCKRSHGFLIPEDTGLSRARRYWTFSCQKILDLIDAIKTPSPPPHSPLSLSAPPLLYNDWAIPWCAGRSRAARLQPTGPSTLERSPAFIGGYKNYCRCYL